MLTGIRFSFFAAAAAGGAALLAGLLPRFRGKRRRETLLCAVCALSLLTTALFRLIRYEPLRRLDGQAVSLSGTVCEAPRLSDGRYYYVVEVDSLTAETGEELRSGFRIRLGSPTRLDARKYDRVTLKQAYLYAPTGGWGYTSRSSCEARRIGLAGNFSSYQAEVFSGTPPPAAFPERWSQALREALRDLLPPEEAGLACGILLGDRDDVSQRTQQAFRTCGISHLLAVSGFHLSFLVLGWIQLLEKLLRSKRLAALLSLPVLGIFLCMIGFPPSATRAGIMLLLYLLSVLLLRQADPMTSLGAAVLVMGCLNPCAAGDVGLQLSFLATLGLQLCSGACRRWAERCTRRMTLGQRAACRTLTALSCSGAASLFLLPVTLSAFGTVSLIAPVMNLFAELPAQLLLQSAMGAAVTQALGLEWLARPLGLCAGWLAKGLNALAALVARLAPPLPIPAAGWALWTAAGLLLAVLCRRRKSCRRLPAISGLLLLTLLLGLADAGGALERCPSVTLLEAGDGLAVEVQSGEDRLLLLSGCSRTAISRCEEEFSRAAPNVLLLPGDYHRNSALAARGALQSGTPELVALGGRRLPDEIGFADSARVEFVREGRTLDWGGGFSVEHPAVSSGDWYRLETAGCRILIAAGPCDAAELPLSARRADVLVRSAPVANGDLLRCGRELVSESGAAAEAAPVGEKRYSTGRMGSLRLLLPLQIILRWN